MTSMILKRMSLFLDNSFRIVQLEDGLKDKQKQLTDLQVQYETIKSVVIRQDHTLNEEQSHIDQTTNKKKLITRQSEGLKKQLTKLKIQQRTI